MSRVGSLQRLKFVQNPLHYTLERLLVDNHRSDGLASAVVITSPVANRLA
ncbi:predicted protein [Plenodomus lingam JN3]|uniref:Predicted protein n=1 Tax=Leptosphaeria maculans (strain JN3 / isolate v23.1.3 / race Av1-4-5-6-7-8) TaxID=985895 RepID=E4ZZD9_LEPMJ|nr:predicted protein [Plenodomus lingam JN3]CBX96734.1 predicted protein [Plenodomus lingam JN3]